MKSNNPKKYKFDYGMQRAEKLVTDYERFDFRWHGKKILDFGCHWGYLLLYLQKNRGINDLTGVDLYPHWNDFKVHNNGNSEIEHLNLIEGDILKIADLQDQKFDLILNSEVCFALDLDYLEDIVEWFYDHLVPGGRLITSTKTWISCNSDDSGLNDIPYSHLFFSKNDITKYFSDNNLENSYKDYVPYVGSTYVMLHKQKGFDIVDVYRKPNPKINLRMEDLNKLSAYDPIELETKEIMIDAVKPKIKIDLDSSWRKSG